MSNYISKFITIYVNLLVIIALLTSIGVFTSRQNLEVEIFDPVYIFNMTKIIDAFNKAGISDPFLRLHQGTLAEYGIPESYYKKEGMQFILPFDKSGDDPFFGWNHLKHGDPWYQLGISNDSMIVINTQSDRTNFEKMSGLQLLYASDYLEQASRYSLNPGSRLSKNPLTAIKEICDADSQGKYDDLAMSCYVATEVYSFVSVSNHSSVPIDDIFLNIDDTIREGMLELIGWTSITQAKTHDSNSPCIKFHIMRLEPNQSIELLIRGKKYIRNNEIRLTTKPAYFLNKFQIVRVMWISLAISVFLFLFEILLKRIHTKQH